MNNYDNIDLLVGDDGDIIVGPSGDLTSTEHDRAIAIQQEIVGILKSRFGDYELYPTLAADLHKFVGEPNTRDTAKKLEKKIKRSLANTGIVQAGDIEVKVNAIGLHSVMIQVILSCQPTAYNSVSSALIVSLLFNSNDGNIAWAPALSGGV